eukprot:203685_1
MSESIKRDIENELHKLFHHRDPLYASKVLKFIKHELDLGEKEIKGSLEKLKNMLTKVAPEWVFQKVLKLTSLRFGIPHYEGDEKDDWKSYDDKFMFTSEKQQEAQKLKKIEKTSGLLLNEEKRYQDYLEQEYKNNGGRISKEELKLENDISDISDDLAAIYDNLTEGGHLKLKYPFSRLTDVVKESVYLPWNNSSLKRRMPISNCWKVAQPITRFELYVCMKYAAENGKNIKAMGTEYGWTNITFTNGMLIDMFHGLNFPYLPINIDILNDKSKQLYDENHLYLTMSGSNQQGISMLLWDEKYRNKLFDEKGIRYTMLTDTTGYSKLSIGGVLQVGATGMGRPFKDGFGGLNRMTKSICLLTVDKNRKDIIYYQIEGANENAVHDRVQFEQYYDGRNLKYRPKIILIQDDEMFNATINNLGLYGVIYSVYVETMDAHFLIENRYNITYKEFKTSEYEKILNNKSLIRYEFWILPYTSKHTKYSESCCVIVSSYERAPDNAKVTHPVNMFNGGLMRGPLSVEILGGAALVWITRILPGLAKYVLCGGIGGVAHKKPLIINAPDILLFGSTNGVPNNTCGFGMNYVSKDNSLYACDQYIALCNNLLKKHRNQFVTSTVAMRYSQQTLGLLSFANNTEPIMWFEQPMLDFRHSDWPGVGATPHIWDTINSLQNMWIGNKQLKGKPHLGLWFNVDNKPFRNHTNYQINTFMKYYKKFNASHLFSNQFSQDIGFDMMAVNESDDEKNTEQVTGIKGLDTAENENKLDSEMQHKLQSMDIMTSPTNKNATINSESSDWPRNYPYDEYRDVNVNTTALFRLKESQKKLKEPMYNVVLVLGYIGIILSVMGLMIFTVGYAILDADIAALITLIAAILWVIFEMRYVIFFWVMPKLPSWPGFLNSYYYWSWFSKLGIYSHALCGSLTLIVALWILYKGEIESDALHYVFTILVCVAMFGALSLVHVAKYRDSQVACCSAVAIALRLVISYIESYKTYDSNPDVTLTYVELIFVWLQLPFIIRTLIFGINLFTCFKYLFHTVYEGLFLGFSGCILGAWMLIFVDGSLVNQEPAWIFTVSCCIILNSTYTLLFEKYCNVKGFGSI